ncbi:MAG: ABC transporter permease [Hyphomicrobium sp.]
MAGLQGLATGPVGAWVNDGLKPQLRVVGAMVLRETRTRFGKSQLGYFWAIAEPLGQVIILSLIFGALSRHPPFGSDMMLFFATGVLPFTLFNALAKTLSGALDANKGLMAIPIIKPLDALLARAALEVATILFVMILIFTGLVMLRDVPLPHDMSYIGLSCLGLALNGFGIGCINAIAASAYPSWRSVYDILSRPLLIISGVFYVPEFMPQHVREILAYLPTLQGIEIFRLGYYFGYRSSVADPYYLLTTGVVLCLLGLAVERIRRIRSE